MKAKPASHLGDTGSIWAKRDSGYIDEYGCFYPGQHITPYPGYINFHTSLKSLTLVELTSLIQKNNRDVTGLIALIALASQNPSANCVS